MNASATTGASATTRSRCTTAPSSTHLPYLPFPPSWPAYLPKDMLADWFEAYAWAMELNFWTGTELAGATYDASAGRWNAVVRHADGTERTVRPRHLIFANGLVGFPRIPDLPGLKDFEGDVMHTAEFTDGANWRGKKALVMGTGTSGHDVAQDLHANGCEATIIQRGSTYVVSIDPAAKLIYGIYKGIPLEDGDLLVSTNTLPVFRRNLQLLTARMVELDRKMIDGLVARGFKWDRGEDSAGHQMLIRTRYGGYYLDAGCAQLIIEGEVGLLHFDEIERFVAGGALLKDGSVKPADLVVLATGFVTQEVLVGKLLGDEVAKKVGRGLGHRPGRRDEQHVEAHSAGGPLVRGRQLYQLPDLFALRGPADQGDRGRASAETVTRCG